jgi:hypothetical protein
MSRRTAAPAAPGDHVIKRRTGLAGAVMLGRGRCRKGGAENNRGGKRDFCLAEHFGISLLSFAV